MSITLNNLALELIRAAGENSSDSDYVLTVEQWIRDVLDDLAIETNWRAFKTEATFNTVAAQTVYKLAVDARDIRFLREPSSNTDLIYLSKERMSLLNFTIQNQSRPQFWYYYDSIVDTTPSPDEPVYEIGLHPVPDTIYTLNIGYQSNPTNLITSSIIPLLSDNISALRSGVRALICVDDKDYDGANWWKQKYQEQKAKLKFRDQNLLNDRPVLQIRDLSRRTERRLARLDPTHFH